MCKMDVRKVDVAAAYIEKRLDAFRRKLEQKGLDAAIVMAPENVFYFSNFNQVLNSWPLFVVVGAGIEPCLLVFALREDHARTEAKIKNIQVYGKWSGKESIADDPYAALKVLLGTGPIRLGLETGYASIGMCEKLKEALNVTGVSDIAGDIDDMRNIKDPYEVDCIRKAAVLVDRGVEVMIDALASGVSEAEACTEGQYAMRKLWHARFPDSEVCGFGTRGEGIIDSINCWCLSNGRLNYGCDCPIHYTPQTGDLVMPMAWGKIDGYHAENERTIYINEIPPEKKRYIEAAIAAREAVFGLVKPGAAFRELYSAAAKAFTDFGFGNQLPGRIGHGIGLCPHEHLSVAPDNQLLLAPGMVFTIEPGMMHRQWGGSRISDTIVVTEKGYEPLTKLPDDKLAIRRG